MNLTTVEGVKAKLLTAKTKKDWNQCCDEIKAANGNNYPQFWFHEILLSGFMSKRMAELK